MPGSRWGRLQAWTEQNIPPKKPMTKLPREPPSAQASPSAQHPTTCSPPPCKRCLPPSPNRIWGVWGIQFILYFWGQPAELTVRADPRPSTLSSTPVT